MREKTKVKIREFIKPYFLKLPMPVQRGIYNGYMSNSFPKFLGKFGIKNIFKGWGMTTKAELPWVGGIDNEFFLEAFASAKTNFEFSGAVQKREQLDEYMWRLWIICYAVRHAVKFCQNSNLELVECGVGDGLSAFFALKELKGHAKLKKINNFSMHLYDSWMPMRGKELLESEKNHVGSYGDLSIGPVKRNLSQFKDNVVYHQGFIPESFNMPPAAPKTVAYLHIDVNSAMPTKAALELFFPKMPKGSVILFDDYGWKNYHETKNVVDKFFAGQKGILMPLPTGQAIYYR